MADYTLTPEPFLNGYDQTFGPTRLTEVTDLSMISIAQPLGGRAALAKSAQASLGVKLPAPGLALDGSKKAVTLMGMGPDQFLALLPPDLPVDTAMKKLAKSAYCTDQTHNWVGLRLDGPLARAALERICPVDINAGVFPPGSVARTTFEHLGAIILAEKGDSFLLLSASSSAGSFLHAVTTSIRNVS